MPDVTCMGIVVADIIVRPVDAWPQRGRLALEESIVLRSGGLAHTTGVVLAKLGVDTAVVGAAAGRPHQHGSGVGSLRPVDAGAGTVPASSGFPVWQPG